MALKMKNPMLKKGNVKGNYGGGAMPMVSPMRGEFGDKLKSVGKGISAAWRASATENVGTSIMHGKQKYKKSQEEYAKKRKKASSAKMTGGIKHFTKSERHD
jgi:hypothetical protein